MLVIFFISPDNLRQQYHKYISCQYKSQQVSMQQHHLAWLGDLLLSYSLPLVLSPSLFLVQVHQVSKFTRGDDDDVWVGEREREKRSKKCHYLPLQHKHMIQDYFIVRKQKCMMYVKVSQKVGKLEVTMGKKM